MTRKSRREIERAVDDLTHGGADAEAWVREYIDGPGAVEMEYCVEFVDDGGVTTQVGGDGSSRGGVCIGVAPGWKYYADPGDIPSEIDSGRDLPVRV